MRPVPRTLVLALALALALAPAHAARRPSAQLQDLFAFPKYDVQFLNDLPLSAGDAARARRGGLGGEDEFLSARLGEVERRTLGEADQAGPRLELVPVNYVHPETDTQHSYLCLLPSANTTAAQTARGASGGPAGGGDADVDVPDALESWKALSHLDGRCIYLRQGWFTYSYCHDAQIRQFREARHPPPHPPGGYVPQEDTAYDAYTLGQAHAPARRAALKGPPAPPAGAAAPPDRAVSYGLSPSARYLVQRWSGGTRCDKTGRPRETEVQVHCSMTSSDVITMVKEVAICQYVVVIHSPHLCSLPGFRAPHADVEPAPIRCREVVDDDAFAAWERGDDAGQQHAPPAPARELAAARAKHEPPAAAAAAGDVIVEGTDDAGLKALLVQSLQTLLDQSFGGKAGQAGGGGGDGGHARAEGEPAGAEAEHDSDVFILSLDGDNEAEAILFDAETLLGAAGDDRGRKLLARLNRLLGLEGSGDGADGEDGDEDEDGVARAHDEL